MRVSQDGDVGLAAEIVRRLAAWREAGRKRHVGSPEIRVVLATARRLQLGARAEPKGVEKRFQAAGLRVAVLGEHAVEVLAVELGAPGQGCESAFASASHVAECQKEDCGPSAEVGPIGPMR